MQPWQVPHLEEIRNQHIEFAKEKLEGDPAERDRTGDFSPERWRLVGEHGVLGRCLPEKYGGIGGSVAELVAAYEGLGYGCHDTGFFFALLNQHTGIQMTLNLLASDFLKEKFLPDMIAGKSMCAYAFTEEVSGSDAFSMDTVAAQDGDGYRINGKKCFLTNSPYSNLALVFAKTSEKRSPFGLTAFMVDMDWEGASHGREFEKTGYRTVRMGEMIFDNVYVPRDHIIGRVGAGLQVLTESTGWERAVAIACALGPMARNVDVCIERGKERQTYDKPIGSYQAISTKIANMVMRHRVARQVIYDMAARLEDGQSIQPFQQEAAMTKLFVSENYIQSQMDAVQIFGVRGILLDWPYQQDLRDSITSTIWAGTSETLRNIIAKFAGLPVN